jgi:hypothetical protein
MLFSCFKTHGVLPRAFLVESEKVKKSVQVTHVGRGANGQIFGIMDNQI